MQKRCVYDLKTRSKENGKQEVWDPLRKKFVALTPEEWVRQQFIQHLIVFLKYPPGLIAVERGIRYNGLSKRIDLMVFDAQAKPFLLAEFKSPEIAISHNTLFQTSVYNHEIKAPYVVLDNYYDTVILNINGRGEFAEIQQLPKWNRD